MPTFTVTRDASALVDSVFNVQIVDTANPFGDYAVIKLDDRGGNAFENFQRGTRVDVDIDPDDNTLTIQSGETVMTDAGTTDTYTTVNNAGTYRNQGTVEAGTGTVESRFVGYVVERRETEEAGADVLEVEAYSFDQFLRRNTVSNDQTGNLISEALADIIQTDSPVTYDAANVTVGDDQELTRSYRGEPVENALRDLAFKSNNEEFGVNDDLEFFFRPRETRHIDRGVDNTQWINYDIPELGKQAINEVEVWFAGGDESVIVDDSTDKLDLQDNLGLPDVGTQRAELNRPEIQDIADAEDVGRKYLQFRNATLSGTVTTFGLFNAEPGDTIDVTIDARGIDTEFQIASVEYRWGRDQTILTLVERRGEVDGILTELSDSVQRIELADANRDAPKNRITTTTAGAVVSVTADADGNMPSATKYVNDGRRAVRDAWTGDAPPDVTTLVVGSDGSGLSRSNTSLRDQTASVSVSQSLPDATSVEFSASVTETGVEELGLETAGGTLVTRAVFDSPVDLSGTVTVTLSVDNDASVSRGVLTADGQTAVRDVLADNAPALPDAYAYGSDDTAVSESDTSLGNEVVDVSLDEILVQDADTQSEWQAILPTLQDTTPVVVDTTGPRITQTCFTTEGENATTTSGTSELQVPRFSGNGVTDGDGVALEFNGSFQDATWEFTPQHRIPAENFEIQTRFEADNSPRLELTVNGEAWEILNDGGTVALDWRDFADPNTPGVTNGYTGEDFEAGTTYSIEITSTTNGDFAWVDVIAPRDNRFNVTLDNTLDDGTDGGRYLDGPELYPSQYVQALQTANTRRNITDARFVSSWNDVSNNQYIELANDGQNFTRFNNTETGSVTFASLDRGVDTNLAFSRYGSRTTATPQTGFQRQQIDSWELYVDPQALTTDDINKTNTRAVVAPNTITGKTIREAGLKSGNTLLTRHVLAEFDVLQDQRLASSETTEFLGETD